MNLNEVIQKLTEIQDTFSGDIPIQVNVEIDYTISTSACDLICRVEDISFNQSKGVVNVAVEEV